MNIILSKELPLPPSINSYYSQSRSGHRFKTNEAKAWENEAGHLLGRKITFSSSPVKVILYYYFKDNRSDLGNRTKILIDLLQKMEIIDNDNQVMEIHEFKNINKNAPRVEIVVTAIGKKTDLIYE